VRSTIVVMGVSGAGKSTVAAELGRRLDRAWLDADDLHPPANLAKLRAGVPLDDADRGPWLDALVGWIDGNPPAVVACSALRRAYRDHLRTARMPLWFAHLDPPVDALATRLAERRGHVFNPVLLPDQVATLEPLAPDEAGVRIPGDVGREDVVGAVLAAYGSGSI
jgi:gluconokinase